MDEYQKQTISVLTKLAEEYTNEIDGAISRRDFEDTKKNFEFLNDVLKVMKPLTFVEENYKKLKNIYFQIYRRALDVFVPTLKPVSKIRTQIYGELETIMKKVV